MTVTLQQNKEDRNQQLSVIEQVVVQGDLSKLDPAQRVLYYKKVCESSGLNPYTRPFDYIILNGKLTLYTKKDATEQLRKLNGISIEDLETSTVDDIYIVKAKAKTKDNRIDQSTGAVTIGNLKGDAKANAIMKAETKAKRRVTLSICGLGWTDESELDSIPNLKTVEVDHETGEIKNQLSTSAEVVIEKMSPKQEQELESLIKQCSSESQVNVRKYISEQIKVENLLDAPIAQYAVLRKKLLATIKHEKDEQEQSAEEAVNA